MATFMEDVDPNWCFKKSDKLWKQSSDSYYGVIGPKRDEVTGEWRKLHNEELRDLYSSPNIIRIIKSRKIRWVGHVARMGRRGTRIDYWWERQRERDH
jgi:hypothetical protein